MSKLKNYDPGMFELFERVFTTKTAVVIPFDSLNKAKAFGLRMQRLRRDMRSEGHHMLYMAEAVQVSVNNKTFEVSIQPPDMPYIEAIQKALARLPEVSKEVEDHELNHTSLRGYAGREIHGEAEEAKEAPPSLGTEDNDRAALSPAQEALKKFMGGE